MMTGTERVAFIGLGRMGSQMASHLLAAGYDVVGVDPSPEAGQRFASIGGTMAAEVSDVSDLSVVLSSLPGTSQTTEVYAALLPRLKPGSLCIDLSTMSVGASQGISTKAAASDIHFVDAPVSGTSTHAAAGTLVVMIGGSSEAFELAQPYITPFSSMSHHCGGPGMGLEMKLITNRLLTAHLGAIAEAIIEIEQAGLDVDASLDLLRSGAVPRLLDYKATPMARRDRTPLFTVDLMKKDLRLADERRRAGPITAAGAELMRAASAAGFGESDIAAVIELCAQSDDGVGNASGQ